jgi:hypothetical protein
VEFDANAGNFLFRFCVALTARATSAGRRPAGDSCLGMNFGTHCPAVRTVAGDRGRDRLKIMRVTARGSECSPTPDPACAGKLNLSRAVAAREIDVGLSDGRSVGCRVNHRLDAGRGRAIAPDHANELLDVVADQGEGRHACRFPELRGAESIAPDAAVRQLMLA